MAIVERALDCIDDSQLAAFARKEHAGEVAACLKEILDRVELPPWEEIPDVAEIRAAGGLDELSHYRIPDTRITISKVEQGPRRHEYLFSPGTVDRATGYYRSLQSKPYRSEGPQVSKGFYQWYLSAPGHPALAAIVDPLPDRLRLGRTWGVANWKWPGLILNTLVAGALITLMYRLHVRLTKQELENSLLRYWLTLIFPVAVFMIPFGFKYVNYHYLTLRSTALYVTDFGSTLVTLLAALVIIFALSNRVAASVIASPNINAAGLNAQLIRIVAKLASLIAAALLFLIGGQYLGIPIATLLTSAGIGGVALALGAQDSLKTLFATLSLLSDKPFRVGERIIVESHDGVVEDVGLRSTSMRLLNGHLVSLPNDQLAGSDIENVGRRKYIRRDGEIRIPLDSSCEKVKQAVAIIRDELQDHEGMDPDHPPRVFFDEFISDAFTIKFIYWYSPPEYWKFKEFGDRFNFSIFRQFEEHGIQFSLPSRHTLWKHDDEQGPLDVNLLRQSDESSP